jgi:2-polyprenyl-6-hydroxyphenyl methylase / 3-demethylubiquinone-9 3-methyltransferase
MTMESSEDRIRYDSSHWSREADEKKALDQYLRLGEQAFNKTKIALFGSMTGDVSGKKVLDYGGGAGIMAIPYAKAGADVVLVDAEVNALRTAQFYARREGVEGKIRMIQSESFPPVLKDERFDVILAKDIIEHIQEDQQFLADLSGCQHRGGVLLLSTQNSCSLNYLLEGGYQKYWRGNTGWCGWDQTHLRFYTSTSLRKMLEKAGYRTERWGGVYVVPYNILSWFFLLKLSIEIPALRYCDLSIGRIFPFNRLGWNIIVRAAREG